VSIVTFTKDIQNRTNLQHHCSVRTFLVVVVLSLSLHVDDELLYGLEALKFNLKLSSVQMEISDHKPVM
jgi:hypothetical protein